MAASEAYYGPRSSRGDRGGAIPTPVPPNSDPMAEERPRAE